jgi:hypothetical protein
VWGLHKSNNSGSLTAIVLRVPARLFLLFRFPRFVFTLVHDVPMGHVWEYPAGIMNLPKPEGRCYFIPGA